jgi:hypothetical protein
LGNGDSRERIEECVVVVQSLPTLQKQIERHILTRTSRRVRHLAVELCPERIVLRGQASTYHVKQLAQQGVREVLPHVRLENAIVVEE